MDQREPEDAPLDLEEIRTVLTARLASLRSRGAELERPPEQGTNIGFGKRIGEGTTECGAEVADASSGNRDRPAVAVSSRDGDQRVCRSSGDAARRVLNEPGASRSPSSAAIFVRDDSGPADIRPRVVATR